MSRKTEKACKDCENRLLANKKMAEQLALLEQTKTLLESQIMNFRDENFRLSLDNANLKFTIEKIHHNYTKIVGKLKETVEMTSEVFGFSSLTTNTNSNGQQTQTVHPHRVNGAVLNNPTIKLARFNEINESPNANENLNGNNISTSIPSTSQNGDNRPSTSEQVANTSRPSLLTSPVVSGNKSFGLSESSNLSNGSSKRLSTILEESLRRSQFTNGSLAVPSFNAMSLPNIGASFSDASRSSNSTITELPSIPTLIDNQSASSSWNGSASYLEEPSTSNGRGAATSRGKNMISSTPITKTVEKQNGFSATNSNATNESDSDYEDDQVFRPKGVNRRYADTTVYSSSREISSEWEEEPSTPLKGSKRKLKNGIAVKTSKKSATIAKKSKSLKVVLTKSAKMEDTINKFSMGSNRSSKADGKRKSRDNSSTSSYAESTTSNDSASAPNRLRRRAAAPNSLKEPSLRKKMRRSK